MPDYPAAHSMDSTWFAVDADGEVAVFETGEGGCFPEGDFPAGGEVAGSGSLALEDHELLAHALLARARGDERLRAMLPDDAEELTVRIGECDDGWELVTPLLRSAGVWTYACDEPVATPYLREGSAVAPLRLDDFAEPLRRRFAGARLPVRFREAPAIAPGEHVGVHAWGPVWIDLEGRAHPTLDGGKDFEKHAAEIAELGEDWRVEGLAGEALGGEGLAGEVFEGERFYDAVRKLVGEGEARARRGGPRGSTGPAGDPRGGERGGGLLGWLGRLFGGG